MTDDIVIYRWAACDELTGSGALQAANIPEARPHHADIGEKVNSQENTPRQSSPLTDQAAALADLLLSDISRQARQTMGLFIGSVTGSLEDDRIFQRSRRTENGRYASPAAFRRTLPSTTPAELSIAFGLHGPLLVFAAGASSGLLAVRRSIAWIQTGRISLALAGMMDWYAVDIAGGKKNKGGCRTLLCLIGRIGVLEGRQWCSKIKNIGQLTEINKISGIQDHSFEILIKGLPLGEI